MARNEQEQRLYEAAQDIKSGMLKKTFGATGIELVEPAVEADLDNIHTKESDLERRDLNAGIRDQMGLTEGGGATERGRIDRNNQGIETQIGQDSKKKKDEQNFNNLLNQLAIQAYLDALDAEIAVLDQRIAELEIKIAEIDEQIEAVDEQINAIDEVLEEYEDTGEIELNGDGSLKNQFAESALRDYERRTGIQVDRNNPEAVYLHLKAQREHLENVEKQRLEQERQERQEELDETRDERNDRQRHRDDVAEKAEAVQNASNHYEAHEAICELRETVESYEELEARDTSEELRQTSTEARSLLIDLERAQGNVGRQARELGLGDLEADRLTADREIRSDLVRSFSSSAPPPLTDGNDLDLDLNDDGNDLALDGGDDLALDDQNTAVPGALTPSVKI